MTEKEWRQWIRSRVRAAAPLLWVLEGRLACSPRPLRYHSDFGGRLLLLPSGAAGTLSNWLLSVQQQGIRTIVCLATPGEIKRYAAVIGPHRDLIALYRFRGFVVHHHPIEDPVHASVEARPRILEQLEQIKPIVLEEYHQRAGSLLIHCSGGMDRASPVTAFIAAKEDVEQPDSQDLEH